MRLSDLHEAVLADIVGQGVKVDLNNSAQGYDENQSSPRAIARRSARNKARRKLEKEGLVSKGDGKHVNHRKPLSQGGSNSRKNMEVTSAEENWSEGRRVSAANQKRKKK